MGLFGKLDVDQVPDDPFAVGEGTYSGIVSSAQTRQTQEGVDKFIVNYEVQEPEDSEYVGNNASEWFTYYPDLTESDLAEMDPRDRQQVNRDMASLKRRLKHLGLDDEQLDLEAEEIAELITGVAVDFAVGAKPDKNDPDKIYYNIKYVRQAEEE